MNETTLPSIFEELFDEIKETKTFTIIPNDPWSSNKQNILIELIKPSSSVQTFLRISFGEDFDHFRLDELLSKIFQVADAIQTWGDTNQRLLHEKIYRDFHHVQVNKITIKDIQQSFKTWYNTTFNHNANCGQILEFDDIDGPLCTCTHRPLKYVNEQWSLTNAIAYTFHEKFGTEEQGLQAILALSKLSLVIRENWSAQQVQDYISEHQAPEKNLTSIQLNSYREKNRMIRMPIIFEDETDNLEEWISIGEDNDNTWNLYDDNNGEDEDNQLTSHHQEPEEFKDLDWNDVPNFICQLNYN
ncbi:unnamed protein product, partial [Rotaria sordida]